MRERRDEDRRAESSSQHPQVRPTRPKPPNQGSGAGGGGTDAPRRARQVAIRPTAGNPIVTGSWLCAPVSHHPGIWTLRWQPPRPLEKGSSPPFAPEVATTRLYARGVSDEQGAAADSDQGGGGLSQTEGRMPINLSCGRGEENRQRASRGFRARPCRRAALAISCFGRGDRWRTERALVTVAKSRARGAGVTLTGAAKRPAFRPPWRRVAKPRQAGWRGWYARCRERGRRRESTDLRVGRPRAKKNAARKAIAEGCRSTSSAIYSPRSARTRVRRAGYTLLRAAVAGPTPALTGWAAAIRRPRHQTVIPRRARQDHCRWCPTRTARDRRAGTPTICAANAARRDARHRAFGHGSRAYAIHGIIPAGAGRCGCSRSIWRPGLAGAHGRHIPIRG